MIFEKVFVAASRKVKTLSESAIPAWFALSVKALTNYSDIDLIDAAPEQRIARHSRGVAVSASQSQLSLTPISGQTKIPILVYFGNGSCSRTLM